MEQGMAFKAVTPKVDIQKLEREQLNFWRENRIFERTMEDRKDGQPYVFYEGPPTANGRPGSHHVLARAFKDMFPRYQTMRGRYVLRKGGWDTHGLPVEIEVQKELGIQFKHEVEQYGVAEFNKKCRDSVFRYIADWEKLTERIGFWVSLDDAYVTFTNDYIESVWWLLKQLWEKNLLYKGLKVIPYCPECGTPLSSHEVSLGYEEVADPSVFVRFPVKDKPGTYLLAWTTTPWTLPSNVALAVGENVEYVEVEGPTTDGEGTERLVLAEALLGKVLQKPEAYNVVKRYKGKDLLGWHYHPLYTFFPVEQDYAYVVAGDFVSTEDGTGIVHIAPAYGADDMNVGQAHNLPVLQAVAANGRFVDAATNFRGMWFKDADKDIMRDLKERGLLYRREQYVHDYPFCWRSKTPLMYFARDTWFIRTTAYRDRLIELNQTINWVPDHVKDGRFGNWLDTLKDWALGRERFWGTPLPVWVDDQNGDMLCVGSVAELSQLTGRDLTELDLHRPYVDEITFPNPKGTGGTMRRVLDLIDVWFDSGAMPYAQWGFPHKNGEMFEQQFPADYICEAVDQTRGWFYSLHAIAALVSDSVAYKNVICLGHILDDKGEKMSKSKGNIVDPWEVLNANGADALRWYMYTATAPGDSRRFSSSLVNEVISKFWLTLWNTYSFFVTYANLDKWTPATIPAPEKRTAFDRWLLAELHDLTREVTDSYEQYDVPNATRPVQAFVETLSNWYVRLNRRRFWDNADKDDQNSAYATLYEALVTVAKLIAPAMPFLSEALYRNLVSAVDPKAPPSVHLALWPEYNANLIDQSLLDEMRLVQKLVSLGRAARENVLDAKTGKKSAIGVRQPLARAQFVTRSPKEAATVGRMEEMIKSELNVKTVLVVGEPEYVLNPLPAVLGKKFGKDFPRVQKALREGTSADVQAWGAALRRGETITLNLDGTAYEIAPAECEVRMKAAEGFAFAEDGGYLAAVDTVLTEDLLLEGLAREVVRRVQTLRKDADFDISDRITTTYAASERLQKAISQFSDYIKTETLTEKLVQGEPANGFHSEKFEFDGETLSVGVKRG
jgi:isoleucyl-tRNA synthetase